MLLAALVFFTGITWGLPSRAVDPFLFGGRPAWSGRQIVALAGPGEADPNRASNVSANPIGPHDRPVVVNATDAERARIVRRYRLMSYQPDEWTTLAALASMNPSRGSFDPRLYQYGGPWVYGVGALLRAASAARLVQLTPDPAWYLDHPDAFGRFYVVARAYSAAWGVAGVLAVWLIVRRILGYSAGAAAATAAGALCYIGMPAVVNAAHEAKPHLAGAVLMLLAVLNAACYVERGRGWLGAALLCGAAIGMVPSAVPVVLVIPLMFLLRRWVPSAEASASPDESGAAPRSARGLRGIVGPLSVASAVVLAMFVLTNPFVAINLIRNPAVLRSNVGNSAAFYAPALNGTGLLNASLLIGQGTSFLLAAAGMVGAIALGVRAWRARRSGGEDEVRRRSTGLLLAAPALTVAGVFVVLAGNQPADYARFALPFDLFLLVEAVVAVATFGPRDWRGVACYAGLVVSTGYMGHLYVQGFMRDSSPNTTRMKAAAQIRQMLPPGDAMLITPIEPAPWSMPPADLFRWTIVVEPRSANGSIPDGIVEVRPMDVPPGPGSSVAKLLTSTPISWASKSFQVTANDQKYGRENTRGTR